MKPESSWVNCRQGWGLGPESWGLGGHCASELGMIYVLLWKDSSIRSLLNPFFGMTPCLTHLWASSFAVNGVNSHGHFKLQGPSSIIHINIRGFSPLYLTALKSRGTRSSTCSQGGPLTVKLGHWKSLHSQGPRPTCFYHTGTGAGQKPDNWLCTWLLPPRDSLRSKPMELNT